MTEPRWLNEIEILTFHTRQLDEHGGLAGTRDSGLLRSAVERPKHLFFYENPSLLQLAAAYAFALVKNHPFNDGNKRTAFVAADTFLRLNGIRVAAQQLDVVEIVRKLAAGEINEADFADWLQQNSRVRITS